MKFYVNKASIHLRWCSLHLKKTYQDAIKTFIWPTSIFIFFYPSNKSAFLPHFALSPFQLIISDSLWAFYLTSASMNFFFNIVFCVITLTQVLIRRHIRRETSKIITLKTKSNQNVLVQCAKNSFCILRSRWEWKRDRRKCTAQTLDRWLNSVHHTITTQVIYQNRYRSKRCPPGKVHNYK